MSDLVSIRDILNPALANAKITTDHVPCGPFYFDYIDADDENAYSFSGDGYSFIGVTIPLAKSVFRVVERIVKSFDVWQFVGLHPTTTKPKHFHSVMLLHAFFFIVTHEYCHHVLGHQPDVLPEGDARTKSLRGNLQAQTREEAADGYAAMHLINNVIAEGFRPLLMELLALEHHPISAQDNVLFMSVVTGVTVTWFRHPQEPFDAESIYLLQHPPRAARLDGFMNHVIVWCQGFRPTLTDCINGQHFANLMFTIGKAVFDNPTDADASAQNALMRSPAGQEYRRLLFENLDVHKALMGVR